MPFADAAPREDYAEAVEELAARVLGALEGAKDTGTLARHLRNAPDPKVALAAVRVIGARMSAPYALRNERLDGDEAGIVEEAFRLFPLASADGDTARITAWRDWATAQVMARCGWDVLDAPQPEDGDANTGDTVPWQPWSVTMAQLSPLAVPGLDGPVHEAARRNVMALARGATRAMLRRDPPTAAGLGRWLALLSASGAGVPLDPAALLEHVRLVGAADARTALDVTIGRRTIDVGGERTGA
ncbi:hypothetical protein [Streptomyces sp. KR80]|uniref:hypothetical protein n=1 Tax=Streptomyces sp. KR80 TaxID=3457426 RepID=UPI003FCFCC88